MMRMHLILDFLMIQPTREHFDGTKFFTCHSFCHNLCIFHTKMRLKYSTTFLTFLLNGQCWAILGPVFSYFLPIFWMSKILHLSTDSIPSKALEIILKFLDLFVCASNMDVSMFLSFGHTYMYLYKGKEKLLHHFFLNSHVKTNTHQTNLKSFYFINDPTFYKWDK